eukprot:1159756-Pelagomonas_calceolata.AAC.11
MLHRTRHLLIVDKMGRQVGELIWEMAEMTNCNPVCEYVYVCLCVLVHVHAWMSTSIFIATVAWACILKRIDVAH